MLSDASVQTANDQDQASVKWLKQVLPLIRFRKCRPWTYFPVMHEVLGFYPSEIVVIRKRTGTPIPESAYMADGAGVLKEMGRKVGRVTSIPLVEVSQVVSFPRSIIGAFDNFKLVAAKKTISFSVLQQETPNVYRALPLVLGARYHQKKQIPLTGLYWALSFFLLSLYFTFVPQQLTTILSIIGLSVDVNDLADLMPFILSVPIVVLICAIGYSIPGRMKAKHKTKLKPLKDLSGRQPLRSRIAGRTLMILGSLLVFITLAALVMQYSFGQFYALMTGGITGYAKSGPAVVVFMALGFMCYVMSDVVTLFQKGDSEAFLSLLIRVSPYVGIVLIQTGRRMVARNALSVLAEDSRAPILYLRSFESDVEDTLTPHRLLSRLFGLTMPSDVRHLPLYLTAFFEAHPLRLFRTLFGLISHTTELQLASFFREFGPFIAIGKPGEQLATIGADRVFVGNDEWQKVVTDFLDQSRYVVLQAAGTEGFVWELHTVLETVPPEKLLFCLSNFRERQNDYEDFRLRAESTPGWRFPRSVGNLNEAQFLFFDSNRAPILHAISFRSPIRWMFLGQAADLRHTLARFIDRTDTTHSPYKPKSYFGHGFLAVMMFLTVVPLSFYLLGWAILLIIAVVFF